MLSDHLRTCVALLVLIPDHIPKQKIVIIRHLFCLQHAGRKTKQIARENNCYKMMLLTGSKEESTLNFYRKAGYNSSDKTAFIQWINMEEN